jgi:hypothetical protein
MRIPNTEWINLSPGLTDWQTANDPCTLELGSLWRLPTYSEWDNVDITGGWNTWYDIWASGLKLHASGRLYYTDGNVTERGGLGCYWSSAQSYWQWRGWHLYFHSGYSAMNDYWDKTYGFSVRCLRE